MKLPKPGEVYYHYENPNTRYKVLGISLDIEVNDDVSTWLTSGWCLNPDNPFTPVSLFQTDDGIVLFDGASVLSNYVVYCYMDKSFCRHIDNFISTVEYNGEIVPRFTKC